MSDNNWLPKPQGFGPVPFGYSKKEGDPKSLVPNEAQIALVEQVMDDLDNGSRSLREAALWLSETSGRPISHMGLNKLWKRLRGTAPESIRAAKLEKRAKDEQKKTKTKEHKVAVKTNRKVGAERRRITAAEKRIQKLREKIDREALEREMAEAKARLSYVEYEDVPDDIEEHEIAFKPNIGPQSEFLAADEQEVLYGGAAGGGKSYAMISDILRYADNPNFRGLLLRRTNDELRELKWKSRELYERAFGKDAHFKEKDSEWNFKSGAKLWMSFLERDEDVMRYQGQSFTWIGVDELTQYSTPFAWNYLRTRLRAEKGSGLKKYMRATTNPGGPGHGWVKQMFIDPAPANIAFGAQDIDTGKTILIPEGDADFPPERWGQPAFYRRFIPAKLSDNPYLAEGGDYKANLLSQPDHVKRQLLDGDWSIADGAAFPEFRASVHTMPKFQIPHDWRRFRSCDFGYSSHSAVHWFAIDPNLGTLYVYRELYVSQHTGPALADKILEIEYENKERVDYGVLDSSCWHTRGQTGPTIAEEMINRGVKWRPSDRTAGARINGRMRLHELLKFDEEIGKPGIMFFDTCRQIIADLGVIPTDPKGTDDIDDRFKSDHAYDSVRYGIMSRPQARDPWDWGQKTEMAYKPFDSTFGY